MNNNGIFYLYNLDNNKPIKRSHSDSNNNSNSIIK